MGGAQRKREGRDPEGQQAECTNKIKKIKYNETQRWTEVDEKKPNEEIIQGESSREREREREREAKRQESEEKIKKRAVQSCSEDSAQSRAARRGGHRRRWRLTAACARLVVELEHGGGSHSRSDAHGDDSARLLAALQLVEQSRDLSTANRAAAERGGVSATAEGKITSGARSAVAASE